MHYLLFIIWPSFHNILHPDFKVKISYTSCNIFHCALIDRPFLKPEGYAFKHCLPAVLLMQMVWLYDRTTTYSNKYDHQHQQHLHKVRDGPAARGWVGVCFHGPWSFVYNVVRIGLLGTWEAIIVFHSSSSSAPPEIPLWSFSSLFFDFWRPFSSICLKVRQWLRWPGDKVQEGRHIFFNLKASYQRLHLLGHHYVSLWTKAQNDPVWSCPNIFSTTSLWEKHNITSM